MNRLLSYLLVLSMLLMATSAWATWIPLPVSFRNCKAYGRNDDALNTFKLPISSLSQYMYMYIFQNIPTKPPVRPARAVGFESGSWGPIPPPMKVRVFIFTLHYFIW